MNDPTTFGGIPPGQQAKQSLDDIQALAHQLQQELMTSQGDPFNENLLSQIEKSMSEMHKVIKMAPSALSSDAAALSKNAMVQLRHLIHNPDAVTMANVAMLQGTCNTIDQLLSSVEGGQKINAEALQSSNRLLELSNAMQTHMSKHGSKGIHEIAGKINEASSALNAQLQFGNLNTDQTFRTVSVLETVSAIQNIPTSGSPSAAPVQQLQQSALQLNETLLG
jgi:hypothetical protein